MYTWVLVQDEYFLFASSFSDIFARKLVHVVLFQTCWARRQVDVAVQVQECGVSIGKGQPFPAIACLPPPVRSDLLAQNLGLHGSPRSSSASWVSAYQV
jgi:hypothetical protein